MEVPKSNIVQMPQAQPGTQINPTILAMAAAMMHQEGRFQPVGMMDSLSQYGRPPVKAEKDSRGMIKQNVRPFVLPEDQMNQSGGEYVRQNLNKPKGI